MNKKSSIQIDDELIDEIVDEILGILKKKQPTPREDRVRIPQSGEIENLESRIANLETKLEKYSGSYKAIVNESSQIESSLEKNNEDHLVNLQSQLEDMMTTIIRLNEEIKRIKEILAPSKQA